MREILYSPGFGAGWTTWAQNIPAKDGSGITLRQFMLEYRPFIDHIKTNGGFTEKDIARDTRGIPIWAKSHSLIRQFAKECEEKFGDIPYMGGLDQLEVYRTNGRIRIFEYDGSERVEEEGEFEEWL
jgi:hypothetical protein